ncbi:hypothetical protein DSCA_25960 [Desulfosarcina alkanivorans]|uniref:Methyl-accepting chemotaxis protein n=1 Tax=Desulfosarcina alkanivorans TaxID=571177 RepID=A0A5K7YHQ3_9BACT|nr:methyl-accepting chemotaxis protein [Desulfosarcina alkanivorans]BBO68666.1 hypothetical protein DSCA_25960 [Desulfosarcina alkanivorans]
MLFRKLRLKVRLLLYGIILSFIPLILTFSISFFQDIRTGNMVIEETTRMAVSDLEHIVSGVYATCNAVQEQVQNEVNTALNVARDVFTQPGAVGLSSESTQWRATNQYTKENQTLSLPKLLVGGNWIGKTDDMRVASSIVDRVKALVGGTCTIFQKLDDSGSMLRVATNVVKKDGKRAVGTYIPAVNPDGQANPVVSAVLDGRTFKGRAFVVDRWYITAYEPIYDSSRRIVGMLYVGVPQESVSSLRKAIMDTRVGRTGYITVIDSAGNYVISKNGERDGENILSHQSADGSYPIKHLIGAAHQLASGQSSEIRYRWKNSDQEGEREKVSRFIYFKPWDWIIIAGAYADEFEAVIHKIDAINHKKGILQLSLIAAALTVVAAIWYFVAKNITAPLIRGVDFAKAMAAGDFTQSLEVRQKDEIGILAQALNGMVTNLRKMLINVADSTQTVTASSTELSTISEQLATGARQSSDKADTVARATESMDTSLGSVATASEQAAANVQTVAAAAEQMSATIKGIAANTEQGSMITRNAVKQARNVTRKVSELGRATRDVGNITDTIAEISEQTNLLALNATIEAARAGDAGKGFAVVANEIKQLASQTADATQEINRKINGIQSTTRDTVGEIEQIVQVISDISEIVTTISSNMEEQTATTEEIASNVNHAVHGIQEVNNSAVHGSQLSGTISRDIMEVTQASQEVSRNSSKVHESAENLSALAENLNAKLAQFKIG